MSKLLNYFRRQISILSSTSNFFFMLREIVNIGSLRSIWPLLLNLNKTRIYQGFSIHNAPHDYIPRNKDEILYLLRYHERNLELLLKHVGSVRNLVVLEIGPGNTLGLTLSFTKKWCKKGNWVATSHPKSISRQRSS